MSSNITLNLGKLETTKLISHPIYNIHAIISKRKAIIINEQPNEMNIATMILDEDKDETFMCSEFAETDQDFLVVGGKSGIIKLVDFINNSFWQYLKGHGNSVNSLKTHARERNIIFSGSSDLSIRMWDLKTQQTICIFGGLAGHRDQILSLDVSLCGNHLVSGSYDCTVKIWQIPQKCNLCHKYKYKQHNCELDEIICISFPIFSSSEIHRSFISCVRFFGEFIVAKGSVSRLVMFKPLYNVEIYDSHVNSDVIFIQDWQCPSENICFKFYIDIELKRLVIGSKIKHGEFYDINLLKLEDVDNLGTCNSKVDRNIRDMTIKDEYYYILYEDSIFHRIKRR